MRIEFMSHKDTKAMGWDSMIKISNACSQKGHLLN
jgi:hypothetical protein